MSENNKNIAYLCCLSMILGYFLVDLVNHEWGFVARREKALQKSVSAIAQTEEGRVMLNKYHVETKVQFDKETGAKTWIVVSAPNADNSNKVVELNR